jgi:4-amino-4-deoxy-L-arabinose transferase-like glycosyltransferase
LRVPGIGKRPAPAGNVSRDVLVLGGALLLVVATGIGIRDPWPADEPRFAALARDMATTGEWLLPRVGGDLYQDKPPLFFWLLALAYRVTGSVRTSFLLPSLLSAAGVVLLVYDLGRRLAGRDAGLIASLLMLCTLQFVFAARAAQIDCTLCFLTTLSLYGLLRHLLLGPSWIWYFIAGVAAGAGVVTKGVGFLPLLLLAPFFAMRRRGWHGLARFDETRGPGGWGWWLAPLGMLGAISFWLVPMLLATIAGPPEYAQYRDEILFKQTAGRYTAAWHHVKGWHYFLVEVIPALWLPWSILLVWLVPRWRAAWRARDARTWLPLSWVLLVLLFFSISPGKRGIYILPALPALAFASASYLRDLIEKPAVRRIGFGLGVLFWIASVAFAAAYLVNVEPARAAVAAAGLDSATPVYAYVIVCGTLVAIAWRRAPLAGWPIALTTLICVFSYAIAPAMNPERSGERFTREMLAQLREGELLGLVAYKEQFLLYLDRPTVNFGHRRWLEGAQESFDAAAWLNAAEARVLLVPARQMNPCFSGALAGSASDERWYLVRAPAKPECARQGNLEKAISYPRTSGTSSEGRTARAG